MTKHLFVFEFVALFLVSNDIAAAIELLSPR